MSNYYISTCCGAEVKAIRPRDDTGVCMACKEHCGLEVVLDEE